ncbi:MAG: nuclear transport factor 2 family protein [Chthoniobacter sp.]
MNKLIIWVFLALAVASFGQSAPPADTDEAMAAIGRLREGLVTSFTKGDIDGLLTYLDPDVVVTWQNAEVCRGPEAVRAFYMRMMTGDHRVVREIKSEPEVLGRHVYGDWAVS